MAIDPKRLLEGHVPLTAPAVPEQVTIQTVAPPPDFQGGYVPPAPPVVRQDSPPEPKKES